MIKVLLKLLKLYVSFGFLFSFKFNIQKCFWIDVEGGMRSTVKKIFDFKGFLKFAENFD